MQLFVDYPWLHKSVKDLLYTGLAAMGKKWKLLSSTLLNLPLLNYIFLELELDRYFFCIKATILKRREIQCLPSAGFLIFTNKEGGKVGV